MGGLSVIVSENGLKNDVIAGRNAVGEALKSGREIEFMMVAQGVAGSLSPLIAQCKKRGIPIKELPRRSLDLKLPGVNHQGVALIASAAEYSTIDEILQTCKSSPRPPFILILDGMEDPHNFGAIIRTAEAAGVDGIIIRTRRSVGLSGIAVKVACGAAEYVKIARVSNLGGAIDTLKANGIWIYGAEADGESVYGCDISGPCALVIGSEGRGIGRLIREKCDFLISLPLLGQINSLNASVAAGIMMYEVVRRRHE